MTTDAGFGAAATDPAQATKAAEETIQRIRELTDRFVESAKAAGNYSLEAYEKSLRNLVEFQERAAGATQLDWVSSIAAAHAKFVQDVSNAFVSAARETLK
jgi:predicted RNA-binding Zn ribbon-like protein